jgi:hypothetical protein
MGVNYATVRRIARAVQRLAQDGGRLRDRGTRRIRAAERRRVARFASSAVSCTGLYQPIPGLSSSSLLGTTTGPSGGCVIRSGFPNGSRSAQSVP